MPNLPIGKSPRFQSLPQEGSTSPSLLDAIDGSPSFGGGKLPPRKKGAAVSPSVVDLPHNNEFPPAAGSFGGLPDSAAYVRIPDKDFRRPWLGIPGYKAFVWPVGVEGFELGVDPMIGKHKYLGENGVEVEVTHVGEESIVLSGSFPGRTSAANMNALRDIIMQPTPDRGKILYLPLVLPKYQYVVVETSRFTRGQEERFMDINYTISFVKVGTGKKITDIRSHQGTDASQIPNTANDRGTPPRTFIVSDVVNTTRKIAAVIFDDPMLWNQIAQPNKDWFVSARVPLAMVPDYRMPIGLALHY